MLDDSVEGSGVEGGSGGDIWGLKESIICVVEFV